MGRVPRCTMIATQHRPLPPRPWRRTALAWSSGRCAVAVRCLVPDVHSIYSNGTECSGLPSTHESRDRRGCTGTIRSCPATRLWDEHDTVIFSGTAADYVHPRIGADHDIGPNVTLAPSTAWVAVGIFDEKPDRRPKIAADRPLLRECFPRMAAVLPPLLGGTSIETVGAAESVVHVARADLGQEQHHVDRIN